MFLREANKYTFSGVKKGVVFQGGEVTYFRGKKICMFFSGENRYAFKQKYTYYFQGEKQMYAFQAQNMHMILWGKYKVCVIGAKTYMQFLGEKKYIRLRRKTNVYVCRAGKKKPNSPYTRKKILGWMRQDYGFLGKQSKKYMDMHLLATIFIFA